MIDMDELHRRTKALEQAVVFERDRAIANHTAASSTDVVATAQKFDEFLQATSG